MDWASRPYACIPQGNWNWPSGIIWCNGFLWCLLVDVYQWGSDYSYSAWYGFADAEYQDEAQQLFKVSPEGWVKVIGGDYNATETYTGGSYQPEASPDGYGPSSWLGYQPDTCQMAADDRYIYIGHDEMRRIKRFDTVTYQVDTLIGPWDEVSLPTDGPAASATVGQMGPMRYVADRNALYWWDFGANFYYSSSRVWLRKCTLGASPTVTTIYDSSDHAKHDGDDWDWSWLYSTNLETGLQHVLDDDVIFADPDGLIYRDGYLYWGEVGINNPYGSELGVGALRRIPVDGGPIEVVMYRPNVPEADKYPDPVNYPGEDYGYPTTGWFYKQAHNPHRQPAQVHHPFPFNNAHDMALVGNTLFAVSWGLGRIEDGGVGMGQRMVAMDLDFLLANAPFEASQIGDPTGWSYAAKGFPIWPHNRWWAQTLFYREGSDPAYFFIPYKGFESHDGKLYYLHHLNWYDYMSATYESNAMISVLEPAGAGSEVGFRVKFEGPALQAYAARIPTSMDKQLGPFQLS